MEHQKLEIRLRRISRAHDDIFTCIKGAKKAKEDLDSVITTIGREFILIKVEQPEDFQN
jgi:hypothetical protein